MVDYISRNKAANVLCMACGNAACDPFECSFYKAMEDVPAADVRPVVRGKWLLDTIYPSGVKKFRCSICGYERTVHERYEGVFRVNFCPNCGADMREEAVK